MAAEPAFDRDSEQPPWTSRIMDLNSAFISNILVFTSLCSIAAFVLAIKPPFNQIQAHNVYAAYPVRGRTPHTLDLLLLRRNSSLLLHLRLHTHGSGRVKRAILGRTDTTLYEDREERPRHIDHWVSWGDRISASRGSAATGQSIAQHSVSQHTHKYVEEATHTHSHTYT